MEPKKWSIRPISKGPNLGNIDKEIFVQGKGHYTACAVGLRCLKSKDLLHS